MEERHYRSILMDTLSSHIARDMTVVSYAYNKYKAYLLGLKNTLFPAHAHRDDAERHIAHELGLRDYWNVLEKAADSVNKGREDYHLYDVVRAISSIELKKRKLEAMVA